MAELVLVLFLALLVLVCYNFSTDSKRLQVYFLDHSSTAIRIHPMNKRTLNHAAWTLNHQLDEIGIMIAVLAPIIFSICVAANHALKNA